MKAAIYSPYLDTFGGGEKYMMTIAKTLSKNGYKVDVLLNADLINIGNEYLKNKLSKRFNMDLKEINFIESPIGSKRSFFKRTLFLKNYDILFYLTDGSIFYPSAKRNILHIQSPLVGQPTQSLWGRIKLMGWNLIIYNSKFTEKYSKENWPIRSKVIYPPIDVEKIKPLKKKKIILSVGRFFGYLKNKKHELLIKTFRGLYINKKMKNWSLYLVGSATEGDLVYLEELKALAIDVPVKILPNLNYDSLIKLYGESSIYWHASGFGEEDPTKMEHFGISVVEAMSGGTVPVVVNKGGLPEIVSNNETGFLWNSLEELEKFTCELIEKDNLRERMSKKAVEGVGMFSREKFEKKIIEVASE